MSWPSRSITPASAVYREIIAIIIVVVLIMIILIIRWWCIGLVKPFLLEMMLLLLLQKRQYFMKLKPPLSQQLCVPVVLVLVVAGAVVVVVVVVVSGWALRCSLSAAALLKAINYIISYCAGQKSCWIVYIYVYSVSRRLYNLAAPQKHNLYLIESQKGQGKYDFQFVQTIYITALSMRRYFLLELEPGQSGSWLVQGLRIIQSDERALEILHSTVLLLIEVARWRCLVMLYVIVSVNWKRVIKWF